MWFKYFVIFYWMGGIGARLVFIYQNKEAPTLCRVTAFQIAIDALLALGVWFYWN